MIPRAKRHQVRIVCWGGDGHTARAPRERVAQLVGQLVQLVSGEVVVVIEHVIVRRSAGSLGVGERSC